LSQPVRVSAGDADAAEPAIAAAPDGTGYVAWVNHGPKTEADVMIARFTGDGQLQSPAVRVNLQKGIATAWRGDPRNTSAPKRATSYRLAAMAIISIAQHARPNVTGQMAERRAHCTIFSTVVVNTGSSMSDSIPMAIVNL